MWRLVYVWFSIILLKKKKKYLYPPSKYGRARSTGQLVACGPAIKLKINCRVNVQLNADCGDRM